MVFKSKYYFLFLVLILFDSHAFSMDKDQFFVQSNVFFQLHVADGLVKYNQLKNNKDKIHELIIHVDQADLTTYDADEKLAFYINAYNLLVINHIIEKYPVDSPMNIPGFFDRYKHRIAGESLTLNDLENKKIRTYHDPRIHFVLVCAALGCPKPGDFSYVPGKLDMQLTQQTELALNDPNFLQIDGNNVIISEIFSWYAQDFGKSDEDLLTFINKYRKNPLPEKPKLSYYTYDWTLNE